MSFLFYTFRSSPVDETDAVLLDSKAFSVFSVDQIDARLAYTAAIDTWVRTRRPE